jgi:hypothetical protein
MMTILPGELLWRGLLTNAFITTGGFTTENTENTEKIREGPPRISLCVLCVLCGEISTSDKSFGLLTTPQQGQGISARSESLDSP